MYGKKARREIESFEKLIRQIKSSGSLSRIANYGSSQLDELVGKSLATLIISAQEKTGAVCSA